MHVFCGVTIKKVLARSPACSGVVPETVRVWMMAVHGLWVADPGLLLSGFLFWLRPFLFLYQQARSNQQIGERTLAVDQSGIF